MEWAFDPVLFKNGSIEIRWYGLMFFFAIFGGTQVQKYLFKREGKDAAQVDTMVVYAAIGLLLGMRLVHCFFYNPSYYFANPSEILMFWKGGYASHGGYAGLLLGLYFFCKKAKISYLWFADRITVSCMLGGALVRIGNFTNSEILGRATESSWGVIFQRVDSIPRHPVQLYEAACYLAIGIAMFLKLRTPPKVQGKIFCWTIILAFGSRFLNEFFKEPQTDAWISGITMGQILSVPWVVFGIWLLRRIKSQSAS